MTKNNPLKMGEKKIAQVAKYKLNLTWECPSCSSVNKHFYPIIKNAKDFNKDLSINNIMAGTIRECISCANDYILGSRQWR